MTAADKIYFDRWAQEHTLQTITFFWYSWGSESECRLHNKTYNQALAIAKDMGYKEPRWYNPRTWLNGVITVG